MPMRFLALRTILSTIDAFDCTSHWILIWDSGLGGRGWELSVFRLFFKSSCFLCLGSLFSEHSLSPCTGYLPFVPPNLLFPFSNPAYSPWRSKTEGEGTRLFTSVAASSLVNFGHLCPFPEGCGSCQEALFAGLPRKGIVFLWPLPPLPSQVWEP